MADLDKKPSDYERYNVAVWLHRIAPNSTIAKEHFEQMQRAYPDFQPRENPDFNIWFSEWEFITPESPVKSEELLKKTPIELFDFLLTFESPQSRLRGPSRKGLLIEIQNTINISFEWGWEFANLLTESNEWESDIWPVLFSAWKDSENFTTDQRNQILSFAIKYPKLHVNVGMEILRLLEHWLDISNENGKSTNLDHVESLADLVFASAKSEEAEKLNKQIDWLTQAINNIGGRTALVWLKALSMRRRKRRENWRGLPEYYRSQFNQVLTNQESKDDFARIILTARIQFLFSWDRKWTERFLLTLFDWDRDELVAEQSWNGFLYWGQWNEALFDSMLPFTIQTFSNLDKLENRRDRFCEMLGAVAAYSPNLSWDDGWLFEFMGKCDAECRERWAISFGGSLINLSTNSITEIWNRWIDDFWKDRNTGIPIPLTDREKEEMILWSIPMQTHFEEAVNRIVSIQGPNQFSHGTFHRLDEGNVAMKYQQATLRLLIHLLEDLNQIQYGDCEAIFNMVRDAMERDASQSDLIKIADELARLDCGKAQELKKGIERESNR